MHCFQLKGNTNIVWQLHGKRLFASELIDTEPIICHSHIFNSC